MHLLAALLPAVQAETLVRRLRAADISRFHAYRSDADLAKYQGWSTMSLQDATAFIDDMASVSALRPGEWVQLAIADCMSEEVIGDLGLFLENDQSAGEVGFTLCRAAQGQGHATRAVGIALSLLFAGSSVPFVRAVTDARNLRSVHVLESCGFIKSHVRQVVFKGEACTELVYVRQRPAA